MRLPLLLPTDLTAEQRPMYDSFEKMVQAREYSGFEVRNPEGAYIGPWGVFLAIGGQFNVAYELYAHDPLALSAGLRVDQIGALSAGARPADLSEDELLAFDVTKALVGGAGPVPGPLYDAAVAKLGQEGFDAIIFITLHYLALGVLLNAYDGPVGRPVSQL